MKLLLLLILLPFATISQSNYVKELLQYRLDKNTEYRDTIKSPLKKNQVAIFDSLN